MEKFKLFLIKCLPIFTKASIWYLGKMGYEVKKKK